MKLFAVNTQLHCVKVENCSLTGWSWTQETWCCFWWGPWNSQLLPAEQACIMEKSNYYTNTHNTVNSEQMEIYCTSSLRRLKSPKTKVNIHTLEKWQSVLWTVPMHNKNKRFFNVDNTLHKRNGGAAHSKKNTKKYIKLLVDGSKCLSCLTVTVLKCTTTLWSCKPSADAHTDWKTKVDGSTISGQICSVSF